MNDPVPAEVQIGQIHYVVLICEEAIESLVGKDIIAAGAKGYTVAEVRGRGNRGVRDAQWMLSSNVRIEVLCSEAAALRILQTVEGKYSQNYGLVAFTHPVMGPRADKF